MIQPANVLPLNDVNQHNTVTQREMSELFNLNAIAKEVYTCIPGTPFVLNVGETSVQSTTHAFNGVTKSV